MTQAGSPGATEGHEFLPRYRSERAGEALLRRFAEIAGSIAVQRLLSFPYHEKSGSNVHSTTLGVKRKAELANENHAKPRPP
jgi:hypothetical protein